MSAWVCRNCGHDRFDQHGVATYEAWRKVKDITKADGRLTWTTGHTESETWDGDEDWHGYRCVECGEESQSLVDLLVPRGQPRHECACGHDRREHQEQQRYDKRLFTRGLVVCGHPACQCRDFVSTMPAPAEIHPAQLEIAA